MVRAMALRGKQSRDKDNAAEAVVRIRYNAKSLAQQRLFSAAGSLQQAAERRQVQAAKKRQGAPAKESSDGFVASALASFTRLFACGQCNEGSQGSQRTEGGAPWSIILPVLAAVAASFLMWNLIVLVVLGLFVLSPQVTSSFVSLMRLTATPWLAEENTRR
jgi:hypothetical protein